MRTLFSELEHWEPAYLQERLPTGWRADFSHLPLSTADFPLLHDCDALSTFIFSTVTREILDAAPNLKLIATRSTGYDHIDCAEAARRGIAVANVPEYGSNTVAEHTFALILALSRKLIPAYVRTKAGRFSTAGLRGFDLRGRTLGVIGSGNIGLHVIRMALAFGMRVIAYDPFPRRALADVLGFEYVSFDEVLRSSDVITLHCPATPENYHLIRGEALRQMKRGAILINTARGTLVDTHDLLQALETGQIGGAGLDVLEGEQAIKEDVALTSDLKREQLVAAIEAHRLLSREDVIATPHNAFNSEEAVRRILDTTLDNIRSFAEKGRPAFPVTLPQELPVA